MLRTRIFRVVIVSEHGGFGADTSGKNTGEIRYNGKERSVVIK
jgi:hypothetical protein